MHIIIMDPTQSSSKSYATTKLEYATQYFGFTPKSLCDAFYNAMFDSVADAMESFKGVLTEEWRELQTTELGKSVGLLHRQLLKEQDTVFDKLDVYLMNNILNVPDGVLLPEDCVWKNYRDRSKIDDDIEELTEQIKKVDEENLRILQEMADLANLDAEYEEILETFPPDAEVNRMKEYLKMNCSKVKTLLNTSKNYGSAEGESSASSN